MNRRFARTLDLDADHHRRVVEITRQGVWLLDAENKTTFMNHRMAELLGCEADMGLGRPPGVLLDEGARAALAGGLEARVAGQFEVPFIRGDGATVWTLVDVTPSFDAAGNHVESVIMVMDITDRKRAESAVRERDLAHGKEAEEAAQQDHNRLRDLIDGLGPSMFVGLLTPEGILIEANRPALAAAGLNPEDVLGMPFEETFWWRDLPQAQRQLRAAIERGRAGEASRFDVQVKVAEDHLIDIDFSLHPLRDALGQIAFLVPSGVVITDRKLAEAALRETNESFHQLADNITDAFWIRSADMSEVHYVSPAFERIWGRTTASLYADPDAWSTFIVAEDRERVRAAFAGLLADSPSLDIQYRIARPDGELRWIRVRGYQVRDAADRRIRQVGIVTDVTDLRKATEALQASTDELRMLAEAVPHIVWIAGPDGANLFFNQRWVDYTGLTLEETLGGAWSLPIHPEDAERVNVAWKQAMATLGRYSVEARLRRHDGEYRWWLVRCVPQLDSAGGIVKWFGTCTDIHDLKLAELEISRSNRALKMLSTCSEALVRATGEQSLLDDICRVVVENGYRMAWVGYAEEDPARSIRPIAHAGAETGYLSEITVTWSDGPLGQGPAGQAIRTGQAVVCEDIAQDPGCLPWIAQTRSRGYRGVVCLPLRIAKDAFGVLALYSGEVKETNASELKLLQQLANDVAFGIGSLRARAEQERLESELRVSDRMASVGTLAAGVAHEINSPLAAVIANLDYLTEHLATLGGGGSLGEEIKGPLVDAREAAQRVRLIVRDLKTISHSPTDDARGPVDVNSILESSLRMASNEIRHRARVVKQLGRIPPVAANEARLGQVLLNLLVNAAQALPEGRAEENEIRVTSRLDGDRVVIEVKDSGPGIAPEIIGKIFDPFFTTKKVGDGIGLGLAICKRIVTDLAGQLTVTSTLGEGASFRVSLPGVHEEPRAVAAPVAPAPVRGRRGRILIVDDEDVVLRVMMRILGKEHDVVTMRSAREALALCARETFDLILCDLMMPDMTGMELHQELQRVAPAQASRMIFVTGGAFTDKARQFLSATTNEQIAKPFDPSNLRAVVQRHLRADA